MIYISLFNVESKLCLKIFIVVVIVFFAWFLIYMHHVRISVYSALLLFVFVPVCTYKDKNILLISIKLQKV
jgi:hypothetical protein